MLQAFLVGAMLMSPKTEIQVNICQPSTVLAEKLGLNSWKKKSPEESRLLDSRGLSLYRRGWVLKVKSSEGADTVEVTLKKNSQLQREEEASGPECEYDLHGNQKKLACKLSHEISKADFARLLADGNLSALLSPQQLDWLKSSGMELPPDLQITSKFIDQDYSVIVNGRKYDLGLSKNPQGREFTEISTRADGAAVLREQAVLIDFLRSRGVLLCGDQGAINTRDKLNSFFNP